MDARSWSLLFNTFCLVAGSGALALPVGLLLAWLLGRTDIPGRVALCGALVVVLFWPLYVHAAAWQAGFGLQGWYTLASEGLVLLEGWGAAAWIHALAAVPWIVLIVALGLRTLDPAWEEQALLDGTQWQVFRGVTIRLACPVVAGALIWTSVLAAGEMTVTDLFMIRTYAEELYTSIAVGMEPGELPLRAAPGILLTALLLAAGAWLSRRLAPPERVPETRQTLVFRLGPWRWPAFALALVLLTLIVGIPVGNLAYKAGVVVEQAEAGRIRSFSLLKCLGIVLGSPWRYAREFAWSLVVGSIAATLAVTTAAVMAWSARKHRSGKTLLAATIAVGLATPGPVVGVAVIWLMNRPEAPWLLHLYDYTVAAPVLASTVRCFPVCALVLWYAIGWLPEAWLDAARLEGAGPVRLFFSIGLAERWPAVVLAWLLGLIVAIGDLAATILVVPPGVTTLSIRIFGLLHYGVEDQVAGICLAMMLVVAGLLAAGFWLFRRFDTLEVPTKTVSPR